MTMREFVCEFYLRWPQCLRCFYCGIRTLPRAIQTDPRRTTVDHVIPLSGGGREEFGNLVWACNKCNATKAAYPLEVFRAISGLKRFYFEQLLGTEPEPIRMSKMRIPILVLAIMAGLTATAQTPPQFVNLPADSTDYTCTGVVPCPTWQMPAQPAPGASYTDPNYGTTTWRLHTNLADTASCIPAYSRVQSFSADNSRMFCVELPPTGGVYTDLYDATTTPPTLINRISPPTGDPCSLDASDNDAAWGSGADATKIFYNCGSNTGFGTQLRMVDVGGCTPASCSPTPTILHTFSCVTDALSDLGAGVAGNKIETGSGGQGGMVDATGRYFVFTCDKVDGAGRHEIDFIRYDRTLDTVTTQEKWYNVCPGQVPTGCAVWSTANLRHDLMRISQHPNGQYVSIIWQAGGRDATWTRGEGTEIFDPSFNYLGVASPYDGHQDMGYDVSGVPVWVGVSSFRNNPTDDRAIAITNLTTLSQTAQTYRRILLPCSYNRSGPACDSGTDLSSKASASHISMVGSWGSFQGYGLFSSMMMAGKYRATLPDWPTGTTLGTVVAGAGAATVAPASMAQIGVGVVSTVGTGAAMESVTWSAVTATTATATFTLPHAATDVVRCLSCGDTGFGAMENLAVRIDTTAVDGSPAVFYRIGRTMGIRDNWYNAEPHSTVSRGFEQIIWGSTWNQDANANTGVSLYGMRLVQPPQQWNLTCAVTQGTPPTVSACSVK